VLVFVAGVVVGLGFGQASQPASQAQGRPEFHAVKIMETGGGWGDMHVKCVTYGSGGLSCDWR